MELSKLSMLYFSFHLAFSEHLESVSCNPCSKPHHRTDMLLVHTPSIKYSLILRTRKSTIGLQGIEVKTVKELNYLGSLLDADDKIN